MGERVPLPNTSLTVVVFRFMDTVGGTVRGLDNGLTSAGAASILADSLGGEVGSSARGFLAPFDSFLLAFFSLWISAWKSNIEHKK